MSHNTAAATLLECLEKLIPIYQRMKMILDGFGAAESKRVHLNNQIEACSNALCIAYAGIRFTGYQHLGPLPGALPQ